jgi:hypothetical protein
LALCAQTHRAGNRLKAHQASTLRGSQALKSNTPIPPRVEVAHTHTLGLKVERDLKHPFILYIGVHRDLCPPPFISGAQREHLYAEPRGPLTRRTLRARLLCRLGVSRGGVMRRLKVTHKGSSPRGGHALK